MNYYGRASFHTFPSRTWRTVYTTNKELARLEDARVTLLTRSTFFPYKNSLARSAGSGQSEHARALLARAKASTFLSYKLSLKLSRLGMFPSVAGKLFSLETGPYILAEWQNYLEIRLRERSNLKTFVLGSL